MRPAKPCFQSHATLETLWVWDPWSRKWLKSYESTNTQRICPEYSMYCCIIMQMSFYSFLSISFCFRFCRTCLMALHRYMLTSRRRVVGGNRPHSFTLSSFLCHFFNSDITPNGFPTPLQAYKIDHHLWRLRKNKRQFWIL